MNALRTLPRRQLQSIDLVKGLLLAFGAAAVALFIGALVFILGVRLLFADKALPGVEAAGVDLSGLSQPQIEAALGAQLRYAQSGKLVFTANGRQWVARPEDVGVVVDVPTMARQAIAWGRTGSPTERVAQQVEAWFSGHTIVPVIVFDQRVGRVFLHTIADQIDQPKVESGLKIDGTTVQSQVGQVGREVDIPSTLALLNEPVAAMHDATIALVVRETQPLITDPSPAAATAERILSAPLQLTAEGADPLTIQPTDLAKLMRFDISREGGQPHFVVSYDANALASYLIPLEPKLQRSPENARFIFNDQTRQLDLLKPAVIGRTLDLPGSIVAIEDGLTAGQHQIPIKFDTTDPAVTDNATAEQLGITENVVTVSTYFNGSTPERIQNIKTASAAFHGLLVAPGQTLSMADILGDISLDKGYAEALIIYGNRTINGVGGGVCQVSTTLFRAVFFGGYQIVERHPHAYRVLYYEQGPNSPGPGLDATVFVPLVDFKFTNDSQYWLLMETYIYGNQLVWKFYSTSDGRSVTWSSTGPQNVVKAPDPLYKENPDLPKGKIKQTDYQADGMDVTVYRTVSRDGQVISKDTIKTHYLPWRAIYEYGPGTDLPKDAKTK